MEETIKKLKRVSWSIVVMVILLVAILSFLVITIF
jgi:hypothetical protein